MFLAKMLFMLRNLFSQHFFEDVSFNLVMVFPCEQTPVIDGLMIAIKQFKMLMKKELVAHKFSKYLLLHSCVHLQTLKFKLPPLPLVKLF